MLLRLVFPWLLVTVLAFGPARSAGINEFTTDHGFDRALFDEYWDNHGDDGTQPQPKIKDVLTGTDFLGSLTNPNDGSWQQLPDVADLQEDAQGLVDGINRPNSCETCMNSLRGAKAAMQGLNRPITDGEASELVVHLCNRLRGGDALDSCKAEYHALGPIIRDVLLSADVEGYDGRFLCARLDELKFNILWGHCPEPLDTGNPDIPGWFSGDKPDLHLLPPPRRPGNPIKVLHLSDVHVDPRYANGEPAKCTNKKPCCRNGGEPVEDGPVNAPRFGHFGCDAPLSLVASTLDAVKHLSGMNTDSFTLFTGDLISHDPNSQRSKEYVKYSATLVFNLFRSKLLGPVYAAFGNHDTYPANQAGVNEDYDWVYKYVKRLWEQSWWVSGKLVERNIGEYGNYMVKPKDGLRIISLNTNLLWDRKNYFNYINARNPDNSGQLEFLFEELLKAERAGDRVWIIGHVASGWDGYDALRLPTILFNRIVSRFSPHVIANIFWGDSHEDQLSIHYATDSNGMTNWWAPQTVSWTGPSLAPYQNLNAGFRVYEVDSGTFDILNAQTYIADVNTFNGLENAGPRFYLEYDTRTAYGGGIGFSNDHPLNATWWHGVTQRMHYDLRNHDYSLIGRFHRHQSKSNQQWSCTGRETPAEQKRCWEAKACYMQSGSRAIATERCPRGYGAARFSPPLQLPQPPAQNPVPNQHTGNETEGDTETLDSEEHHVDGLATPLPEESPSTSSLVLGTGEASSPIPQAVLSRIFGLLYRVEY